MVTLITGIGATTLQSFMMQLLPLRRALNIPIVPKKMQGRLPTFKESFQYVKKTIKEKQMEAQMAQSPKRRR